MLLELTIQNYALIESLQLKPGNGLNIITGETGAGKSILLGALGLVLGDRADMSALRNPEKKCVVEAVFDVSEAGLNAFFEENDIDFDPQTILRREILPGGKSRAFINDVPVVLPLLKQLGEGLVDIHAQHESVGIFEKSRQLQMLDVFADNAATLKAYKSSYRNLKQLTTAIEQLEMAKAKAATDFDYRNFLYQELEEANLQPGESVSLESELEWLGNAEAVSLTVEECCYQLKESEPNAKDLISNVLVKLSRLGDTDILKEVVDRLRQLSAEMEDISHDLELIKNKIVADPQRLLWVQERMGILQKLMLKHKVSDVDALIDKRNELDGSLQAEQETDDKLLALSTERDAIHQQCLELAAQLRQRRTETAKHLSERIHDSLKLLSLPNAQFEIRVQPISELNESGSDMVMFFFNANQGGNLQTLGKVASGGELSRLMLVLKSILAEKLKLPTLILDEIDSGISGEIAMATARMISNVAVDMQVIAITHLPQMASRGQHHFHVYKEDMAKQTFTRIKTLDEQEKLLEIARMISGNEPGEIALAHARELMMG